MRSKVASVLTAAFSLAVVQVASAADMPTKAPIVKAPVAAPFSWTGCHIGAQAGYTFGSTTPYDPVNRTNWTTDFNYTGGVVGGGAGCNYQTGVWVFGIEGDWSWTSVKGTTSDLQNPAQYNTEIDEKWLATLRGRIGYAWNNMLLYVTGGGAWSSVKFWFPAIAAPAVDFTTTKTVSGWTIGVGAEYALNRNWSVKGEWLYIDFGTPSFIATSIATGVPTNPANTRMHQNLLRLGVNYKF